jgi:hypothetical protein
MHRVSSVIAVSYEALQQDGESEGVIALGTVQRVTSEGGKIHHAIHDGPWWAHPGLAGYDGQQLAIYFNPNRGRVDLVTWPGQQFLTTLASATPEA